MLEIARILAVASMIPLILAIGASVTSAGRLALRRSDPKLAFASRSITLAAWLLMLAVGLSGFAAVFAISWLAF